MMKIGEFSVLTGISIHMLRNYDKISLLRPEQVDDTTGYRFYGEKQIVRANRILILKSLGFGLGEISDMLCEDLTGDSVRQFIESKIREKEVTLAETEHQILRMKRAIEELEHEENSTLSVSVKKLPMRKVVSLRDIIKEFTDEGVLWEKLNRMCSEKGVKLADVPYSMAMTHSVDFEKKRIDTEVFLVVDRDYSDIDGLRFSEMPETEAAVVAFEGVYSKIGEINRQIYRWIMENGYKISGKAFSIYYISPANEKDPQKFITEICYPIKK